MTTAADLIAILRQLPPETEVKTAYDSFAVVGRFSVAHHAPTATAYICASMNREDVEWYAGAEANAREVRGAKWLGPEWGS